MRVDYRVLCWGTNENGLLGGPAGPFVSLSAGPFHACGVRVDQSVECWGQNNSGQALPPEGMFASVSAGTWHTCGLSTDYKVECGGEIDEVPTTSGFVTDRPDGGYSESPPERYSLSSPVKATIVLIYPHNSCSSSHTYSARPPHVCHDELGAYSC